MVRDTCDIYKLTNHVCYISRMISMVLLDEMTILVRNLTTEVPFDVHWVGSTEYVVLLTFKRQQELQRAKVLQDTR